MAESTETAQPTTELHEAVDAHLAAGDVVPATTDTFVPTTDTFVPTTDTIVEGKVLGHVQDAHAMHFGSLHIELPSWLTLHQLMFLIACGVVSFLFIFRYRHRCLVPTGLTNALEVLVLFVRDEIAIKYLGREDGRAMAPTFLSFFFMILTMNLLGMIPGGSTATANFSLTTALAAVVLFFMVIGAMLKNGVGGFFGAFIPHGVPMLILPMIFFLELLGVFIKAGVLALRLMANLLAGHIALFTIIGLLVTFGFAKGFAMLGMTLFVFALELFVSVLQAYIFTLLSAIFIGQIYHPEH